MESNVLRNFAFVALVLICYYGIIKGDDSGFNEDFDTKLRSTRQVAVRRINKRNSDIPCNCSCCGQSRTPVINVCVIEIVLVLDRSSFHAYDKDDMTAFLTNFLIDLESKYELGPLNVRIGIILFSTNSVAVFRLNEYADSGRSKYYLSKLIHTIENVSFVGQASNIGDALVLAAKMFREDERGLRCDEFRTCYYVDTLNPLDVNTVVPKIVIILSNAKIEPDDRMEKILRYYKSLSIEALPVQVSRLCSNPPCGNEEILKMIADTNRKKKIFNMEMQQRAIKEITICIMETCTVSSASDEPLCEQCTCTCEIGEVPCPQERNCDCGITGIPGPKGAVGPPGRPGNRGLKGASGIGRKGAKGFRGRNGNDGVKGRSCVCKGNRGRKGECGEDGDDVYYNTIKGNRGPKGYKGTKGGQGDQGNPGAKGYIGFTGPPGIPGPPGNDGYMSEVAVHELVIQILRGKKSCDCCAESGCQLNLVFVIDASASVSSQEFSLSKDWIKTIVRELINYHVNFVLADVLAFSVNCTWPIQRESVTKSSYANFERNVDNIQHVDKETVMASALQKLTGQFQGSYDKILLTVADYDAYYESLYYDVTNLKKKFDASLPILIDNFTRKRNFTAVNRLIKNPSGTFTNVVRYLNYSSLISQQKVTELAEQITNLCRKSFYFREGAGANP